MAAKGKDKDRHRRRTQDGALAKLRHLLGIERLGDKMLDRMCKDNMRLATVVCPVVALGALVVFLACGALLSPGDVVLGDIYVLGFVTVLLLLACALLFRVARQYVRGQNRDRHRTHRYLALFISIGYVYAIALAVMAYATFGRMSVMYIFLIISGVLFVFSPVIQIVTTLVAITCFFLVFHALGLGDTMMVVSSSCVTFVIIVAGLLRYDEQYRSVRFAIESDEASRTDVLTKLKNRLAFDTEYARLANHGLIVAMTDIDDFKYFNDAYSHETGDEVLKKFAGVLEASFPRGRVYRYGGDEFVVVAVDTRDEPAFRGECVDFMRRMEGIRLDGNENERISASLGYGFGKPHNATELSSLLHLADRKLYEAKRSGKSRFVGAPLEKNDISRESTLPGELPLRRSYETDQLTGLPNMQFFRAHGIQFASHLSAAGKTPVVVYFNLANFKIVNERHGYRAGDDLLCETADAIQDAFPNMLLALIAEDHFALVCPSEGLEAGFRAARELVDAHKKEPAVVLKAGACPVPADADDIGGPYDSAKIACDSIKLTFGHDLRFYDGELDERVQRRRYVLDNIHDAIRRGDIVVWYQPVYRAMTGRLSSCEALVRWKDERYGMIPPGDFIGLLEDTQQITELDGHVMARVCDDWKTMHDAGETTVPVSVNFSRVDFQLVDVADIVEENVRRVGMPRQMVHIEVTESAFNDADESLAEQIEHLRALGYEVWMDDFGSGYSSLNQLKWHDFDLVKIDMAFLRDFENEQTKTLVASIVDMLKRMGVHTLIEGVETRDQFEFMRACGCEFVQGYYLSKPIEFHDFRALLGEGQREVEPFAMRGYYNAVSQVNVLSQVPFSFSGDHITAREASRGSMPLAILERREGSIRYLMKSASFSRLLERLGVNDQLRDPESAVDLEQTSTARHYADFLDAVVGSGELIASDFIIRGHDCVARGRKIASYGDADAVLLSLEDRSRNSGYSMEDQIEIALSYVNVLFDRVDVLDVDSGSIRNALDRTGEAASDIGSEQLVGERTRERAETVVHPEDSERYLRLFDMQTLEERLARSKRGYLGGMVRMLSKDGAYCWKVLLLIPAQTESGNFAVICRRDANPNLVEGLGEAGERIMDDMP